MFNVAGGETRAMNFVFKAAPQKGTLPLSQSKVHERITRDFQPGRLKSSTLTFWDAANRKVGVPRIVPITVLRFSPRSVSPA